MLNIIISYLQKPKNVWEKLEFILINLTHDLIYLSSLKIVVPYMCNPSFSGMTVISFNGHLMVVFYFDINKQ